MAQSIGEATEIIQRHAPNFFPKVGIILGSGLASVADEIANPISIPFQAFGLSTGSVHGHASLLVMGHMQGVPVVCLKGRLHLYEGTPVESIARLIQIIKHLGVHALVITGAAGSLRENMGAGEIMLIKDHINFMPGNPLVGPNDESVGPRFVNMEGAYDPWLIDSMVGIGNRLNIPLHQGVYLSTLGPIFETPAEIRMFRTFGADAVGMSVVPEVILARHSGIRVLGLAAITNLAAGMSKEVPSHDVTLQQGEVMSRKFVKLIPEFVKTLGAQGDL